MTSRSDEGRGHWSDWDLALRHLVRDLRLGSRLCRRSPVFVMLSVLTLGFAVGANATVYMLVNAVWLEPRPVTDPDRLVVVTRDPGPGQEDVIPEEQLEALRAVPVFAGVAGQASQTSPERPRMRLLELDSRTEFLAVTPDYFRVLGLLVRGRDFHQADDVRGAAPVAVISDHLWRTAFGSRPDVFGSTFETEQGPVTIVGIAPAGFRGARLGERVEIWIPMSLGSEMTVTARRTGLIRRRRPPVVAIARLRPGVTPQQAADAIGRPVVGRYVLLPLPSVVGAPGQITRTFSEDGVPLVVAMALLVLMAGCATLAALVLAHLERRRREFAIRMALGCGRGGLIRTVFAELVIPAVAGAAVAVMAASWTLAASRGLPLSAGLGLDRLELGVGWKVIGFGLILGVGTMAVAATIGLRYFAWSSSDESLSSAASTSSTATLNVRRGLLAAHVALTVVVLTVGLLLQRTVSHAVAEGAGFDVEHTLFVSVEPSRAEFFDPVTNPNYLSNDEPKRAAYHRLMTELRGLPGLRAVAVGETPIRIGRFGGTLPSGRNILSVRVDAGEGPREMLLGGNSGGPEYLEALGLRLLAGRAASAEPNDVLVTQSLAERFWPGADPLGRVFSFVDDPLSPGDETKRYRVVGVMEDFVQGSLSSLIRGGIVSTRLTVDDFVPFLAGLSLVARATSDPDALVPAVEQIIERVFPLANRSRVMTGRQLVEADFGRQRLGASFFSGFGFVSLLLGFGGVFGLVAYLAESRVREFGVRLALGATPGRLMRSVAGLGLIPVAVGIVIGLMAAALLSGVIAGLIHGVSPWDPVSYGTVAALVAGGATAAGFVAAWRVRRASPMQALRAE